MSVRKRIWKTKDGKEQKRWVVDYVDQHGRRRNQHFERKKQADDYQASVKVDVSRGTHTPVSQSVTVAEAAELWLKTCEQHGLERSTLTMDREHVKLHIDPYLGRQKLSHLSTPLVRGFEDKLRTGQPAPGAVEGAARSPAMVRKIRTSLSSLIADAQERGLVARNVVRELRSGRRRRALREWKLACPKTELDLAFSTSTGRIEHHKNAVRFGLVPAQIRAGVTRKSEDGRLAAKYTGLHALRHFYASWCINRRIDGGLELPPKVVQERLGHASITMTMDVYGHLFPRGDDAGDLAEAESSLLR